MVVSDDGEAPEPPDAEPDDKGNRLQKAGKAKAKVKAKAKPKHKRKPTSSQGSKQGDAAVYSRAYRQIQQFPATCLVKQPLFFVFWSHITELGEKVNIHVANLIIFIVLIIA